MLSCACHPIALSLGDCRRGSLAPRGRRAQGPMLRGLSDRLLGRMRREVRSIFTLSGIIPVLARMPMPGCQAGNRAPYIAFHWLLFRWFLAESVCRRRQSVIARVRAVPSGRVARHQRRHLAGCLANRLALSHLARGALGLRAARFVCRKVAIVHFWGYTLISNRSSMCLFIPEGNCTGYR